MSRAFEAKYRGHCERCDDDILPGEALRWDPETDEAVHAGCVPAGDPFTDPTSRRAQKRATCPDCHLQLPCFCDPEEQP